MQDNLHTFSLAISVAQNAFEEAHAAATLARDARDNIAGRLQQMVEERVGIATRRAGGEHHPDDAGRLALIDMDSSGLAALLVDAEAACTEVTAAYLQAGAALAAARTAYAAEEARSTGHAPYHSVSSARLIT